MRYTIFLLPVAVLLFFGSCSKFDDLDRTLDSSVELAGLAVFNTVPNSTDMEIYLDDVKINVGNQKLTFGGYLPYQNRLAGKKKVKVVSYYRGGQETPYEGFVELHSGKVYSLFVNKEKNLSVVLSEDDVIKPRSGFAKIRVAHMSSDATAFSFQEGEKSPLFNSIKYKDVTDFIEIRSSTVQRTFSIHSAAAAGNTLSFEQDFVPKDQGIYTLLIKGYVHSESEAEAISMQLLEHK